MRVAKYRWYTFSGSYQHIQNYFDYDLFANPLNPPTGTPFVPVLNSPHAYYNRQNLYNFDIVVLPMQTVSFRFDYNRNRFIGPSYSSIHEGTDVQLNQDYNNTLNGYRFGADARLAKKTTLSYTQMFQQYSGDTLYSLNPFNSWPLPNGTPVTFGLPWFNSGSPCSTPLNNGVANPSCNGFLDYTQFQQVSTFIPTEQVNLQSSSLKWLDFNGQYQYSHARSDTPLTALFSGLTTRSSNLGYNTSGSSSNSRWNSSSADVSAIFHVSDRLRLVETFRFRDFSVSGNYLDKSRISSQQPVRVRPPCSVRCSCSRPRHYFMAQARRPTSSTNRRINLIGQNIKQNDFQVQYDISRFFGVRAGFVWSNYIIQPGNTQQVAFGDIYYPNNPNRGNCAGLPLNPDGSCTFSGLIAPWGSPTTEINRYSGVVGAWFRKGSTLHANVNAQFGGADNWIYRIDPLSFFNISGNVSYSPPSVADGGSQPPFPASQEQHQRHPVQPAQLLHRAQRHDQSQQVLGTRHGLQLRCHSAEHVPLLLRSGDATGSSTCVGDDSADGDLTALYQTHTQFGYFALTLTPIERRHHAPRLQHRRQSGQHDLIQYCCSRWDRLSSIYQSPLAAVDVLVHKNVTFKAGWNYYQYGEGSFVGPTAPRYFHANNTTLALRYAF